MQTVKQILTVSLSTALIATLVACGGGGGGGESSNSNSSTSTNTSAQFDSTEFQGTWKRIDGTVAGNPANCFNFTSFGGTYGGLNRPAVFTDTTITDTVEVYSDNTCATYLGLLVRTYSVTWSAGTVAGKTNVAKATITSTGFSIQRDGAAGYSLSSPPASGVVTKTLFDVDGSVLFVGSTSSTKDADGYPTALQASALYSR